MAHAVGSSLFSFLIARSALGFGKAGVFPASIKTVAEWFPKKERALATGIFNAGTNIGAILTPLFVPWIAEHLGWRRASVITGALGFAWLILWLFFAGSCRITTNFFSRSIKWSRGGQAGFTVMCTIRLSTWSVDI